MGRSPCCSKEGLNRGAWTAIEDKILKDYIQSNGEGKWRNLPKKAGLKRCGKSCRLRWLNYLRPDIIRGNISADEEDLIVRLHKLLGNRWSLIAGRLPGRTDNEIKNYWNTTLGKRTTTAAATRAPRVQPPSVDKLVVDSKIIRPKASRCTKVIIPAPAPAPAPAPVPVPADHAQPQCVNIESDVGNSISNNNGEGKGESYDFESLFFDDSLILKEWDNSAGADEKGYFFGDNANLDLDSLGFLLDYEEWPNCP